MTAVLIVVPCRAGSSAIPGKNVQPIDGRPLICRTLDMLAAVGWSTPVEVEVVVSTDDPVVIELTTQLGVQVIERPADLAGPDVTLPAVVAHAAAALEWDGPIGCAQVTSPFLRPETVAMMLDVFLGARHHTGSTVVAESGLRWLAEGAAWFDGVGVTNPLMMIGQPVARQQAETVTWRETGGLRLWASPGRVMSDGLTSSNHLRWEVDDVEGLDIDTRADLATARDINRAGSVLFVVAASDEVGAGHLHRTLALIDTLPLHHVEVVFDPMFPPDWAWDLVESHAGIAMAYSRWERGLIEDNSWDVVVFDKLDTTTQEVAYVRSHGAGVLTLEDLGPGAALADAVVNELYPGSEFSGPAWSVLRPEFRSGVYVPPPNADRVLVTFGGTDPAGLNRWVAEVLARQGYDVSIAAASNVELGGFCDDRRARPPMAAAMRNADLVVTSRGRTVTEAMAMGRPVVSIAANQRELQHWHHDAVVYLGHHALVDPDTIVSTVKRVLSDEPFRAEVAQAFLGAVDGHGADRIGRLIETLIERYRR